MPIDLVIDERDGSKPDLGDTNNNSGAARASTADTSHTDGSSTPDVVSAINRPLLSNKTPMKALQNCCQSDVQQYPLLLCK